VAIRFQAGKKNVDKPEANEEEGNGFAAGAAKLSAVEHPLPKKGEECNDTGNREDGHAEAQLASRDVKKGAFVFGLQAFWYLEGQKGKRGVKPLYLKLDGPSSTRRHAF